MTPKSIISIISTSVSDIIGYQISDFGWDSTLKTISNNLKVSSTYSISQREDMGLDSDSIILDSDEFIENLMESLKDDLDGGEIMDEIGIDDIEKLYLSIRKIGESIFHKIGLEMESIYRGIPRYIDSPRFRGRQYPLIHTVVAGQTQQIVSSTSSRRAGDELLKPRA